MLEHVRPHRHGDCPDIHGDLHVLQPIVFHGIVAKPGAITRFPLGSAYHAKLSSTAASKKEEVMLESGKGDNKVRGGCIGEQTYQVM